MASPAVEMASVIAGKGSTGKALERRPRYRTLDAWRGLACLMVVVHHAAYSLDWSETAGDDLGAWLRWGCVFATTRMKQGVTLFFVISGYCIAASVDAAARESTQTPERLAPAHWKFLGKRFWRIYPPYWGAILLFMGLIVGLDVFGLEWLHRGTRAISLDSPSILSPAQWFGNLTLTETWRPHLGGPERNVFTAVAWSLCFEEQFYFVCFLALWLFPRRVVAAIALITVVLLGARVGFWAFGALPMLAGTFPLLWHEFAVGLAVYYRLNIATTRVENRAIAAGLAFMFLIGIFTHGRDTYVASGFGMILIVLFPWDKRTADLPSLQFLRSCGRRCYSIYLAHLPVCVIGTLGLGALGLTSFWSRTLLIIPTVSIAAIVVSWKFFDLVESHFLNIPARPARTKPRLTGQFPPESRLWRVVGRLRPTHL